MSAHSNAHNKIKNISSPPAVIISGGSEIVSVAIAEALIQHDIPLVVISLGKASLIRDLPQVAYYRQISWPPESLETALEELTTALESSDIHTAFPWPVFATEDGGLRLLFECKVQLSQYLTIPGAERLNLGGLDKAELFSFLNKAGHGKYLAPTTVLHSPDDGYDAFILYGEDAVFKPALKPIAMKMSHMPSKVITALHPREEQSSIIERLKKAWPASDYWVAQKKLTPSIEGEAEWYGLRSKQGSIIEITAYEHWKSPKMGGTGCWVKITKIQELSEIAQCILDALDFRGIAEMSFLQDAQGNWRLLELNPRPWIQLGLAETAGLHLCWAQYNDLINITPPESKPFSDTKGKDWVQPERMLLAALSGDYGSKLKTLLKMVKIISKADYITIYGTTLPTIKLRWAARILGRICSNIMKRQ